MKILFKINSVVYIPTLDEFSTNWFKQEGLKHILDQSNDKIKEKQNYSKKRRRRYKIVQKKVKQ